MCSPALRRSSLYVAAVVFDSSCEAQSHSRLQAALRRSRERFEKEGAIAVESRSHFSTQAIVKGLPGNLPCRSIPGSSELSMTDVCAVLLMLRCECHVSNGQDLARRLQR